MRLLPSSEGGPEDEGKRRSGAPRGAPVRVMDRQFPSAEGTGFAVRRANGRGVPRLRISALRYPLMGMRRVRNRQFGTTVRRDALRGNAPARLNTCTEIITTLKFAHLPLHVMRRLDPRIHEATQRRKPYVVDASPWMAGSSPAMTNDG